MHLKQANLLVRSVPKTDTTHRAFPWYWSTNVKFQLRRISSTLRKPVGDHMTYASLYNCSRRACSMYARLTGWSSVAHSGGAEPARAVLSSTNLATLSYCSAGAAINATCGGIQSYHNQLWTWKSVVATSWRRVVVSTMLLTWRLASTAEHSTPVLMCKARSHYVTLCVREHRRGTVAVRITTALYITAAQKRGRRKDSRAQCLSVCFHLEQTTIAERNDIQQELPNVGTRFPTCLPPVLHSDCVGIAAQHKGGKYEVSATTVFRYPLSQQNFSA